MLDDVGKGVYIYTRIGVPDYQTQMVKLSIKISTFHHGIVKTQPDFQNSTGHILPQISTFRACFMDLRRQFQLASDLKVGGLVSVTLKVCLQLHRHTEVKY
jgi:hypothetical protein